MKRIKFISMFVGLTAVASMAFLGSCKKDEVIEKPTITVTSSATEVKAGATVTYTVQVSSNQDLGTLTISPSSKSATATANDTVIDLKGNTSKTVEYKYVAPASATSVTITFTIKDEDESEVTTQTLTVTPSITAYPTLQMGGSASAYGSYLDADAGIVYLSSAMSDATKSSTVDLIFDQASFKNTAKLITTSTGTKLYLTTLTAANFDGITTDASFGSYTATADNVTVDAGSVVFFQTASGKKGLLKVISMASATGDVVISIKIQK